MLAFVYCNYSVTHFNFQEEKDGWGTDEPVPELKSQGKSTANWANSNASSSYGDQDEFFSSLGTSRKVKMLIHAYSATSNFNISRISRTLHPNQTQIQ
jgi:hypothetical protein